MFVPDRGKVLSPFFFFLPSSVATPKEINRGDKRNGRDSGEEEWKEEEEEEGDLRLLTRMGDVENRSGGGEEGGK